MSFLEHRTATAAAISTATGRKVFPRQPVPFATGSGWLSIALIDTEDITYGEAGRVTYTVLIALAEDPITAEAEFDEIAGLLIACLVELGRGVVIRPVTLTIGGADIYCAAGTLITEVESL